MKRIEELEELIRHHKALYYQGRPEIPDHQYDQLEEELKKLSPKHPVLEIVGTTTSNSQKIKHDSKMLSLNKTYKVKELLDWFEEHDAVSMNKIDGVSCSLVYEDGLLSLAKTRGDGSHGENITPKVIWIKSIPSQISIKEKIEVRGELYCTEEDFFHLSDEMVATGLDRPVSQRNIVAGLVGRKENLEFSRYISFKAFDLITAGKLYNSEVEKFKVLTKNSFLTPEITLHKSGKKLESGVEKIIEETKLFMSEGDYQIDGIVFSFNELELHDRLGNTAHHPRSKMAFKFQGESKKTKIKKIIWSVSRNGILTPVGDIEPVTLSGAKISRVTLHNYGLVKQYSLKIGDEIEIIRSGEVIPKFLSVVNPSDNKFEIPKICPECQSKVEIADIRLYCSNQKCPARVKETILNFIQKIGMDDLSSKRLNEMISQGLVSDIPDLYKLKKAQLMELDKVKDKLADKLMSTIDKSKEADITTFLSALGIQGGAYNKCEKVVMAGFNTIPKLQELSIEK
ncbi:MAG: NAD-dependent DNA ligase LigA, partial [Halobacteriovoraceae bacterium]|nr:NAD-dependent DNA ligase LigA [Halobacteriovoraceae bacterium]